MVNQILKSNSLSLFAFVKLFHKHDMDLADLCELLDAELVLNAAPFFIIVGVLLLLQLLHD